MNKWMSSLSTYFEDYSIIFFFQGCSWFIVNAGLKYSFGQFHLKIPPILLAIEKAEFFQNSCQCSVDY